MPSKIKLVPSLQRAGLALVAALAASMLVFAGCGKGGNGDVCTSDGDCHSGYKCCPPAHSTLDPHTTTCTTPVNDMCPVQTG